MKQDRKRRDYNKRVEDAMKRDANKTKTKTRDVINREKRREEKRKQD